jgi:hypothetical protein
VRTGHRAADEIYTALSGTPRAIAEIAVR